MVMLEAQVEALLPSIDLVALMRETLIALARGEAAGPVRAVVPALPGMWFAAMPAVVRVPRAALGAKLVIAAPRFAGSGLPTHRAVVVLFDLDTGAPSAWIEAEGITRSRTAAVSVVATQALAARPRGCHAILGTSIQGVGHLRAFHEAGLIDELRVWSHRIGPATNFAMLGELLGLRIVLTQTPDEAVAGADVITTCTSSAEPLFDAASVADGAHVNAVGACVPSHREIPGALVGKSALVVDDVDAAQREAGDVILAVAEGLARWDGVVTLGEVLAGLRSPRAGRVTMFESLGLGVEDVATAAALLELTQPRNV